MLSSRVSGRTAVSLIALLIALSAGTLLTTTASARTLDAGGDLGCAVRDDGQLLCWGAGDLLPSVDHPYGSLRAIPATGVGDAVDVTTGTTHGCAVRSGGAVACWGDDDAGQLGDGGGEQQFVPVPVNGVADAVSVTVGDAHSCALLRDGTVRCWGGDAVGQSGGHGGNGVAGVVSLDAGATSTCAALGDGSIRCWGAPASVALPPAIVDAAAVATGDEHACALRRGGTVICWGADDQGQLGPGTTAPASGHRDVPGLSGVTAIAAGGSETCALRSDRTVACWGDGRSGQLGDGVLLSRPAPVTVTGVGDATAVAVGSAQACALKADGAAVCWGANDHGQLGNDRSSSTATPVPVPGLSGAFSVGSGWGGHRCAAIHDAGVRCWGANDHGQLGDGTNVGRVVPTAVSGLPPADQVSVGQQHSCALVEVQVQCWGEGENGRLGDGSTSDRTTPAAIPGLQARQVSAGGRSTCAITVESTVACWGARYFRTALPDPARWQDELTPVVIAGTGDALEVVTMDNASCALFLDETVRCWGLSDYGQLGNGWRSIDSGSTDPVPVTYQGGPALTGVEDIARVADHSICARLADWTIVCWGAGYGDYASAFDSSGDGTYPLPSDGCALDAGVVSCFGDGAAGQLGDGYQPSGHFPLQPQAAAVVGIGGGVRQPAVASRDVTETPPPGGGGGVTPSPLPPPIIAAPAPTPARPKPFAIKRAKAGRNGRIALTLAVPAAGGVRIAATATVAGRRVTWFATAKAIAVKAGGTAIAITPTAAATKALKKTGRAVKVALRVTFTPKGGRAVVRTTTVSVRRARPAPPSRNPVGRR